MVWMGDIIDRMAPVTGSAGRGQHLSCHGSSIVLHRSQGPGPSGRHPQACILLTHLPTPWRPLRSGPGFLITALPDLSYKAPSTVNYSGSGEMRSVWGWGCPWSPEGLLEREWGEDVAQGCPGGDIHARSI